MSDRFSADEARRIFARAARRQHAASATDGLTVAELTAIGKEAGLDPALVAAEAASERAAQQAQATWHGVPVGIRRSRLLPARLSDAEWERVVDLLRAECKTPGTAEQIGRRREWTGHSGSSSSSSSSLRVRVEDRPEGDLVTIEAPDVNRLLGLALGGTFVGMGALTGAGLAAVVPEKTTSLMVAVLMMLVGIVCYAGAFLSAKLAAARTPDRLEGLLDRIDLISRLDDVSLPTATEGRIDPAHLDAEVEDRGTVSSRSRIRA